MGQALCCIQVDQSYVAVKESFGKFDEVLSPGCHCLPWILGKQIAGYLSLRVQQLDVRCETKTKVLNLVASDLVNESQMHMHGSHPLLSCFYILFGGLV